MERGGITYHFEPIFEKAFGPEGRGLITNFKDAGSLGQTTVEDINQDQKERVRPLEQEAIRLRAGIDSLEREIDRLVRGVG